MPNGRAWSRAEIDRLVEAARTGDAPETLAEQLDRTRDAVVAKAAKLGLRLSPVAVAKRPASHENRRSI
jgi:hypothetical protein